MLSAPHAPPLMHIPDGFLSVGVAIVFWIVSIAAIAYSLRMVGKDLGERQVPEMGVLAAVIFAGQMLNFPVAGGTSGHLIGAALATILLGPWAAIIIMTCVVSIQALIFQDGGLLALGANIFFMGVVATTVAYFVYQTVQRFSSGKSWGIFVGGFLAAWLSVVITSIGVALALGVSGTSPINIALPAMAGVHIFIGVGEGLITAGALAFLYATRRDLITSQDAKPVSRTVWLVGLAIALGMALLSPLASSYPDGLEWVAEQSGFIETALDAPYQIIPDYTFPGIDSPEAATIAAGIVGTLLVGGVAFLIARSRARKGSSATAG